MSTSGSNLIFFSWRNLGAFYIFSWRNLVTKSGFGQGCACFYATSGVAVVDTVCVHFRCPKCPALGNVRV